ncbi:hypothetical protein BGX34_008772, partial [Mortierella sp. NVP85]
MGVAMKACTSQSEKLMAKVKNLEMIKKNIDREMKKIGKELRMQRMQLSGSGSPQTEQSEVVAVGGPGYFQDLTRLFGPVPSLKPVAFGSGSGGQESSSSELLPVRILRNLDHGVGDILPAMVAQGRCPVPAESQNEVETTL